MKWLLSVCCCALMVPVCYPFLARNDDPKAAPINMGFNTSEDEDDAHITSGGNTMYYSVLQKGKWEMLVSKRNGGPWGPGKVLADDWISSPVDDRGICTTPEGKYPQFAYYSTKKDKKNDNFDIYVVVKNTARGGFAAPTPVNAVCTKDDEMYPWLSADGKTLYFDRKCEDGWRVFSTTRKDATVTQGFGEPKMISELPADFRHVTLTPDGKTMYLQGPLDKKRVGLFVSTFDGKTWSKPEELTINHAEAPTGDSSPCLTRDGKGLYFTSDRPSGKGKLDIWAIPVEHLKKK